MLGSLGCQFIDNFPITTLQEYLIFQDANSANDKEKGGWGWNGKKKKTHFSSS